MSTREPKPLACPRCDRRFLLDERFCPDCAMPLIYAGPRPDPPAEGEPRQRARKIDPAYTEGELVRIAGGRNQPEAELIQGLLLERGIPSALRRSAGFDVPDMLAAGPRDVMVPMSAAEAANDVLEGTELAAQRAAPPTRGDAARGIRIAAAIVAGAGVTALVAWALLQVA